jgi:uncharacterized repeat protein (TIGR01451 family)
MDCGDYVTYAVTFKNLGINTEFSDPFILEKGPK